MSYNHDYENYNVKIPYDDIPISRRPKANNGARYGSSSGGSSKIEPGKFKAIVACLVMLIVVNIGLIITLVYHMSTAIKKDVSVNNIYVDASESVAASVAAASKAKWSSVCVAAGGSAKYENEFFTSMRSRGAGIIYEVDESKNAVYFVTCQHVVNGYEDSVYVMLPSQLTAQKVEVVSYSVEYDLAVLKLNRTDILDSCTKVTLANSALVAQGEPVIACGNPLSQGLKISTGVVSAQNTFISTEGSNGSVIETRTIQTDIAINKGNSGGGLFNAEGNFIGLIKARLTTAPVGTTQTEVLGQSFAIPGNIVAGFANNAIANDDNKSETMTKLKYFNLGATLVHNADGGRTVFYDRDAGKMVEKYVVQVSNRPEDIIESGSFASSILSVNDVIEKFTYTNINGETRTVKVYNQYAFDDVIFDIKEGSSITIYFANKNAKTVEAKSSYFVEDEK